MKALSFEGSGLEYFKIWIVNILLTVITLGLYYPWAKVRNRRYFYANSSLEGRNFEYHATGKQLFVGYLISMALFIVYVVIQNISPIGSLIVLFAFLAAFPWIIWRSLKFNLRMTSFSNVRFSFEGLLGGAYFNFMLLPFLFVIALYGVPLTFPIVLLALDISISGLMMVFVGIVVIGSLIVAFYLLALMKKRNTHYAIDGYRYGQGQFSTELETKKFAIIQLKTLGLSFGLMILFVVIMGVILISTIGLAGLTEIQNSMNNPNEMPNNMGSLMAIIVPAYVGLILVSLFILAYSFSRQRAYIFANFSLDEKITFASTLKAKSLAWVMISNLFAVAFSLGLAIPWAKVRMVRLVLENTLVNTDAGFNEYLTEKQEEQSSLGEQVGDAFDVDINVGI